MSSLFPSIENWTLKDKPDIYTPDNLYEYINGAADVFLAYDFQKLATITYENKEQHSFTVDIYQHSNDVTGFGIYSQEKPLKGSFLSIGTQGYYEQGVLNFFKGSYYVKISGFDLGSEDKQILTNAAKKIAAQLEGTADFPTIVKCFPKKNIKPNSEAYIHMNFLGHSFLHSAFTAEYESEGRGFKAFIMQTKDSKGVQEIIDKYLAFVKGKGIAVEKNNNYYRFQDPYYRSSGMMNMKIEKNYLWGMFCKNPSTAQSMIKEIEEGLKSNKLI